MNYSIFKKIYLHRFSPFMFVGLLMVFIHSFMNLFGDDLYFQASIETQSLFDFLIDRYNIWTSRLLLETVEVILTNCPIIVFGILNSLVIVILLLSLSRLIGKGTGKTTNCFLALTFLIYPFSQMNSAGWISTSVVYLWAAAAGAFALIPLVKIIRKENIRRYEYPLYVIALLFSANQEQCLALLFGFGLVFTLYSIKTQKRIPVFVLLWDLLVIASLIFVLLCPGNNERLIGQIAFYLPEFSNFNVIHKVGVGMYNILNYLFNKTNIIMLILTSVLFYITYVNNKRKAHLTVAAIPLAFTIISNLDYLTGTRDKWLPYASSFFSQLDLQQNPFSGLGSIIPALICIFVLLMIILTIYFLYGHSSKGALLIILFCASFASSLILGFSPTVYASVERIFFFSDVITIFMISSLYSFEKECFKRRHVKIAVALLAVFAFFSYTNTLGALILS